MSKACCTSEMPFVVSMPAFCIPANSSHSLP